MTAIAHKQALWEIRPESLFWSLKYFTTSPLISRRGEKPYSLLVWSNILAPNTSHSAWIQLFQCTRAASRSCLSLIQKPLLSNNLRTTWKYLPPWRDVNIILFCSIYAICNDINGVEIGVIGNRMQPIIFAISIHNVNNGKNPPLSLSSLQGTFSSFTWDLFYWLKGRKNT